MLLKLKYLITLTLIVFISNNAIATSNLNLQTQPIEIRLTYDQIHMPDNIQSLGVIGVHGLANINQYLYAGMGCYGGLKGQSGGYFALSLDGGLQFPIIDPLWVDLGGNIGGGGGRSTPVGGGFFVQPHAGLSYRFKYFYLEPYYSYIKFTDGTVSSSQFGLGITFPALFSFANPDLGHTTVSTDDFPIDMSSNYIGLIGQGYLPQKGIIDTGGKINDNKFQLLGCEAGHLLNKYFLIFGQATGAFAGRSNGYADALLGIGVRLPLLLQRLKLVAKLGLGSAGGGGVDTGGGFIVHPTAGLELALNKHFALAADGGYIYAPKGDFKAKTADLVLKYYFENAELSTVRGCTVPSCLTYRDWRVRVLNETYFKPLSKFGDHNPTMQLINLNIDYFLTKYFYASGQASFAYKGKKTGGYFSGLLGPGIQFPIIERCHLSGFGEVLFGTAGGAVLDIGNGALVKPLVGLNYQFNPYWGIQASVGKLMAVKGKFNSTILNVGLSINFATLENN